MEILSPVVEAHVGAETLRLGLTALKRNLTESKQSEPIPRKMHEERILENQVHSEASRKTQEELSEARRFFWKVVFNREWLNQFECGSRAKESS